MDIPIFYLENLDDQSIISLNEETSKHVVQVLRMKNGEQLQLTNGKGILATASIVDDHKKRCTVKILEKMYMERNSKQTCIAISLLKNAGRFEWFLEKATELGISEIKPLICTRTEKQNFRFERMQQIVVSAMIQSKQVWLPLLHEPQKFEHIISSTHYSIKLIAHCLDSSKDHILNFVNNNNIEIYIGPEGDFSAQEIEQALQQNCIPVSLGTNRLRTETAGVVAATFLSLHV